MPSQVNKPRLSRVFRVYFEMSDYCYVVSNQNKGGWSLLDFHSSSHLQLAGLGHAVFSTLQSYHPVTAVWNEELQLASVSSAAVCIVKCGAHTAPPMGEASRRLCHALWLPSRQHISRCCAACYSILPSEKETRKLKVSHFCLLHFTWCFQREGNMRYGRWWPGYIRAASWRRETCFIRSGLFCLMVWEREAGQESLNLIQHTRHP